jgi:F420-dependent oxidoreductase-like protein
MRIGIFGGAGNDGEIDAVMSEARSAEADGFDTYWSSQIFGLDTLTALALVGRETSTIKLGTSVVPTYPRHPMMLAQQALTTQAACGGRLTLGIGPSHQIVIQGMYGMDYSKPAQHTEEYLQIVGPLSRGEPVSFRGKQLSANGALTVKGAVPFPIVVAALGPRMLEIAGRLSDGTLTWCVGPRTLAEHTVPAITASAEKAGRAVPRIICALPVCVTEDTKGAYARAAEMFAIYAQLPAYRAMLDREGVATAADLAITGADDEVHDRIGALADAGVTEFAAVEFGVSPDERARTREVLKTLSRSS